jgi:Ca2+-binding EF-hand superfamily protein
MMKARSIRTAAVAAMLALALGFVTSGCGVSDESQIRVAIETWKEGALDKDVDRIMSIVSGNFSHDGQEYKAGSAAELRKFIVGSIEGGGFDGAEVVLIDMKIDIRGAEASAYPIEWVTPGGSVTLDLIFAQEGDVWRLTDMGIGTRDERRGMPKNAAEAMAWFDKNGDGQISTDEMPEPLRERAMLIDANGDGKLNHEELEAAYQRIEPGGSPKPAAGQTAEQLMSYMDTNGDGKITMDEAPAELKASFGLVDRNGDGGIDVKEAQAMADYNNNRQSQSP